MLKYHFTYIINNEDRNKNHNYISNSPMNACRKMINRYLRDKNEDLYTLNITVINMDTNKRYHYKVFANKNDVPLFKTISKYKTIEMRYSVFIQKVPTSLIKFLEK